MGLRAACLLAGLAITAQSALAGPVLDQVRMQGSVHCAAVERPGVAQALPGGVWQGLTVSLCQALSVAVFGTPDKVVFAGYAAPQAFDRARTHRDQVAFLTPRELIEQHLDGALLPGPLVLLGANQVMVPTQAPEQHLADLAGKGICYLIGSGAENGLNDAFDRLGRDWLHHAYSEAGEMVDAYGVRRCHAIAGEATQLAEWRHFRTAAALGGRLLPESLNTIAVQAYTPQDDAQWAAIVQWTVATLVAAERPGSRWYPGGAAALPVRLGNLGLDPGWQQHVLTAFGDYGRIFEQQLGQGSPLGLPRGPNRASSAGGALLGPFVE